MDRKPAASFPTANRPLVATEIAGDLFPRIEATRRGFLTEFRRHVLKCPHLPGITRCGRYNASTKFARSSSQPQSPQTAMSGVSHGTQICNLLAVCTCRIVDRRVGSRWGPRAPRSRPRATGAAGSFDAHFGDGNGLVWFNVDTGIAWDSASGGYVAFTLPFKAVTWNGETFNAYNLTDMNVEPTVKLVICGTNPAMFLAKTDISFAGQFTVAAAAGAGGAAPDQNSPPYNGGTGQSATNTAGGGGGSGPIGGVQVRGAPVKPATAGGGGGGGNAAHGQSRDCPEIISSTVRGRCTLQHDPPGPGRTLITSPSRNCSVVAAAAPVAAGIGPAISTANLAPMAAVPSFSRQRAQSTSRRARSSIPAAVLAPYRTAARVLAAAALAAMWNAPTPSGSFTNNAGTLSYSRRGGRQKHLYVRLFQSGNRGRP